MWIQKYIIAYTQALYQMIYCISENLLKKPQGFKLEYGAKTETIMAPYGAKTVWWCEVCQINISNQIMFVTKIWCKVFQDT